MHLKLSRCGLAGGAEAKDGEKERMRGRTKPQEEAAGAAKREREREKKGEEEERLVELLVARHYPTMHS